LNFRLQSPLYQYSANHFYSYNAGFAHFIVLDFDYYNTSSSLAQNQMLGWVENDLIMANLARTMWPWIIVYSHRPIYCSYSSLEDLPSNRCYNFYTFMSQWDELWHRYGVDVMLSGHVHSYERMGAIFQNQSQLSASYSHPAYNFTNPPTTIYIVNGIGGNGYFQDPSFNPLPYSEVISVTVGYGVLTVFNGTTLSYQQFESNSTNYTQLDYMWINKNENFNQQGSFTYLVMGIMAIMVVFIVLSIVQFVRRRRMLKESHNEIQSLNTNQSTIYRVQV